MIWLFGNSQKFKVENCVCQVLFASLKCYFKLLSFDFPILSEGTIIFGSPIYGKISQNIAYNNKNVKHIDNDH